MSLTDIRRGDAVIVGAVRTAFGRRHGALRENHPVDLSADVLTALVERTGIDPSLIDDVIWGCVTQVGDQSSNVGRFATLAAGWPETVPGTTVTRACGSSQQALDFAAAMVISGQQDLVIAGGVEVMSRVPMGLARETGLPYGPRVLERYDNFSFNQGVSAELISRKWQLGRSELDEFAASSHEKAARAIDTGAFDEQIVPIRALDGLFSVDECVRRSSTREVLATLKPSFEEDGVIHAGNSSQISDGAAALLVTSSERAKELGLTPLVRYIAGSVVGSDPIEMLTGPVPATRRLLKRTGIDIDEIGAYEINEAFAPIPLMWTRELGADPDRLNPNGGAIALGHPLGASGAGLMTRLIYHMRDHNIRFGLQAMCEGGGTANATLVELVV